jgi:hypothetical protein
MELRLYSFCNFYLSSIQQGIQTGHAAVRLVRKYLGSASSCRDMVKDWADNHETFIILNGGDNDGVEAAHAAIIGSGYPFDHFRESQGALGGMKTCCAVILPESVFNAKVDPHFGWAQSPSINYISTFEENGVLVHRYFGPEDPEYPLIQLLRSSRLAQ